MAVLSTNAKTGLSYDLGICPRMVKNEKGKYISTCGVKRCYATTRLNSMMGDNLEKKLKRLESQVQLLKAHLDTMENPNFFQALKDLKGTEELKELLGINLEVAKANLEADYDDNLLIRGFSFADYNPAFREVFLFIVRNINFRHIIISKTMWLENDVELIREVGEKASLSLGFTKALYPRFKKFYDANKGLKFSLAYTISSIEELEWLKAKDPVMFSEIDVLHSADVHKKISLKKNKGAQKNLRTHLDQIEEISPTLRMKICNMYGSTEIKKKGCMDNCTGCERICRQ